MTEEKITDTGKTLGELAKDIVTRPEAVAVPRINNAEIIKTHGLRIMHFRPTDHHAGLTIAFKQSNRNVLEIATAVVHPFDTFTKKTGTKLAAENFVAGRTAFLPIRKEYGCRLTIHETLRFYFS